MFKKDFYLLFAKLMTLVCITEGDLDMVGQEPFSDQEGDDEEIYG